MERYVEYFTPLQSGGSNTGKFGKIYSSSYHLQSGRGLSSIFSTLFKYLKPMIISGSKAIGKEALKSGSNILENLGTDSFSNLVKTETKRGFKDLAGRAGQKLTKIGEKEQAGEGLYKSKKKRQSNSRVGAKKGGRTKKKSIAKKKLLKKGDRNTAILRKYLNF